MAIQFFHLAPVILTDALFFAYNGDVLETGTASMRQAAYLAAEQQMIEHLQTPLLPTQVSGTYLWPQPYSHIMLEFCRVTSIDSVVGLSFDSGCTCVLTPNSGCASIRHQYGYIDPKIISSSFGTLCGCSAGQLYQVVVVFTAGLPTGVAALDSGLHLALSKIARIHLTQIVNPGAAPGGPGQPGIESWSAGGYSETRTKQVPTQYTPFGMSAEAQYAAQVVKHLKLYRPMALRG